MALDRFSAPVRAWFEASFAAATPPQEQGWPAIADGANTLILAPTGSGKTLSAFLWGIDQLVSNPTDPDDRHTRILYISPLRALAVDVEKNLRAPLTGIRVAADRLGLEVTEPTVGIRTGDTPPDERRRLVRSPPDILITTPESLYLMLTSKARETLTRVDAVIIDEIHALAATKRGAHLSLSLERLQHLQNRDFDQGPSVAGEREGASSERAEGASDGAPAEERRGSASVAGEREGASSERAEGASDGAPAEERQGSASVAGERRGRPQRIGLSATQRPLEEIADFLVGRGTDGKPRPVTIVNAGIRKVLDIEVVVPVDDMAELGTVIDEPTSGPAAAGPVRRSIWPAMHPELLELVKSHNSTLIFVNARRLAERLAIRLNELHVEGINRSAEAEGRAPEIDEYAEGIELVRAHHGSLSRERRLQIEDDLKSGRLKGLVATSSLELGIDMGAVDLVIQVESPGAVSRGLQRIGRAGHNVGQPSAGKLFPKHRHDLLEAAVVVKRMVDGEIEHTQYVRNPLDVLSQHIVAMCALDEWSVVDLAAVVRSSANFAELSDDVLHSVLDLLAGRYPSEEFSELRPRIVWDRIEGIVRGRAGAQRLAVTNAGTIPDRGLFGVFLPDGTRVGELDEEMVYESRPGETFLLGASTWRIEDITFERVIVTPAPGQPGKMPFWHGDGPGRPLELGRAIGSFVREIRTVDDPVAVLRSGHGLDARAAVNLVSYLDEQAEATGALPDDRTIVVERFRDDIGDWRICVLSPFGAQVHAPWGMALQHRLAEEWGMDAELMWSDDGIVLRLPEAVDEVPLDLLTVDPDDLEELLVRQLPQTAMFASRFRECAGRALLLPRRRPDRRTPLWQQRQKAADLLSVAAKYPSFPMLLEATRECMNDVFDVPALIQVLTDLRSRRIRLVPVETDRASPFAQSLMFGWIAVYMYEGDAPLAERRATALSLDRDLLRELLGAEELRELIDPEALADLELDLQCLVDGRRARDADEVHDLLRRLGPLSLIEIDARCVGDDAEALVAELESVRRAYRVNIDGDQRIAAAEDAGRLRDAIGVAAPMGLPVAFTEVQDAPWVELAARYAKTHGPFVSADLAGRYGVQVDRVRPALEALEAQARVVRGEFRPGGAEREWCDEDVLKMLRRRSLAALRREVEPVEGDALGRFLPAWHHIGSQRRSLDALIDSLGQLSGAPLVASVLEADLLPARLAEYRPADLDQLCSTGEIVWVGAGSLGARDGRVRLVFRDQAALLVPPADEIPDGEAQGAMLEHLSERGASFWTDLLGAVQRAGGDYDDESVLAALWDLVWSGHVTNDSLAPLRSYLAGKPRRSSASKGRGRPRPGRLSRLGPPAASGRWAAVAPLLEPRPAPTEVAHARAQQLLERYGVLTREAALGEGAQGGFAGVYPMLKALEERGEVRRGYFVAGRGAAQFAVPGAVDRLRSMRDPEPDDAPVLLAATDPAQPYGASLPWPQTEGRPARQAGAHVVLIDGVASVYIERGGHALVTFDHTADDSRWAEVIKDLVTSGRTRQLEIRKIDGMRVLESPHAAALKDAGFTDGYKGLTWRAPRSR